MKHRNIMIVGTSSGAGKSITVTGLCRVFKKDGNSVCPFKSQNMALNSFVTKTGREMGRAQVVQALASEIEPEAFMNPILLKPTTDRKIQVIVNGKSIGNMSGIEYGKFKTSLKPEIMKAYNHIRETYDISVIEGAGSPVEINIKEEDIANMKMAEMADAPVILVADIDRGGVFASIYGTIMLLSPEERKRVKGVIINKFRGDVNILKPGLKEIEDLTGVPVVGVMPYSNIDIEDEDSVTERFRSLKENKGIEISIIKLKHMSNFTDFDALKIADDVNIKYVTSPKELGNEDIIILPGTKNTIEDLKEIKDNGIATEIIKASKNGKIVIGICGGFQMMGEKIKDPYEIESSIKEIPGLGLLELETVMEKEKNTRQYSGTLKNCSGLLSGLENENINGYEIHQGVTNGKETQITGDDRVVGVVKGDNIFATYIHGIFDNEKVTRNILNLVRAKKGLDIQDEGMTFDEYRMHELDKLEKIMRENIDIKKIYEIIGD
ncbi:Cobyric acid synthase [Fusobacterium sp. DD29]|uniref:cobyric acid synthase n=1 Tax=unclassified Fusobacterium TaxID=2648384 RepID=UPI001B8B18C6|nr:MULTISPECIES: cobyric acid synthase [unclassified Fusobacterium]MBR8701067.1 Cobyric acid synthase [Fusobacterium sp. DD45]MBR8710873.1 Cobyric acid synthase [Fusobacterium sp. DD28]MBR8749085.1 Cobyric acid synthase [Fusobacterium sp. DD29]MBR8751451.1 Cobyric acid synthase [Fusobacterium sp. DD26]MBR8761351.1 Cobyric acid synthase [Fusobacterium sp. DD25]